MKNLAFSGVVFEGDFDESEEEDITLSANLILEAVNSGIQLICCHCGRIIQIDDFIEDDIIVAPQLVLGMGYLTHGSCLRVWFLHSDPSLLRAIDLGARPEDLLRRLQSVPFESILLDLRRAYGPPPQETLDQCCQFVESEAHIIEDRCSYNALLIQVFLEEFAPGDGLYPETEEHN